MRSRQAQARTGGTRSQAGMPSHWTRTVRSPLGGTGRQVCLRVEQQECRRLEQEQQEPPCTEQEHLAVQAQAAARRQTPFGSHMPVHDKHGEDLDYIDNLELEE